MGATPDEFALRIRKWAEKAEKRADAVVRQVVFECAARIIYRSPVDTGRFRSNWYVTLDAPSGETTTSTRLTEAHGLDEVPEAAAGHVFYITNNLPYARRLEYGHSGQAPEGMVRLTVRDFHAITDEAVQKAKAE